MVRPLGPGDETVIDQLVSCFDHPIQPAALARFLASEGHHILVSYEGESPAGFVTGVEMTHPDKGTEMFLYELAVASEFRRRGHGAALVGALADLARGRQCYGMWVLTEAGNDPALATYASAGAVVESQPVMLSWDLRAST